MIKAWQARAMTMRARTAHTAADVASLARLAGASIDLEGWVRTMAARYPDAERHALMLAAVAKRLAEAGRVRGAIELASEAIFIGRQAGKEVMLNVLQDVAPVLTAAGMRDELAAMAEAVKELP
jgi:hypothetical protein